MLISLDHPVRAPDHCHDLELRWLASVNGTPAAHHTLRSSHADALAALVLRGPLPRWSATATAWGAALRWNVDVRPRVLRGTDPCGRELRVADTAAALIVVEHGTGAAGIRVEHEIVVLAAFATSALHVAA